MNTAGPLTSAPPSGKLAEALKQARIRPCNKAKVLAYQEKLRHQFRFSEQELSEGQERLLQFAGLLVHSAILACMGFILKGQQGALYAGLIPAALWAIVFFVVYLNVSIKTVPGIPFEPSRSLAIFVQAFGLIGGGIFTCLIERYIGPVGKWKTSFIIESDLHPILQHRALHLKMVCPEISIQVMTFVDRHQVIDQFLLASLDHGEPEYVHPSARFE